MGMTTKNISITQELASHIDLMVASGRYANASDYMRDLLRRDLERLSAQHEMLGLMRTGIESGDPVEMDTADWQAIRDKARKQAKNSR